MRRELDLLLASLLSLYLELACIRWISANVRIVAYSVNLILIGAFLGLGLGFLLSKKDWRWLTLPILAVLGVAVGIFRRVETAVPSIGVDVWSSYGLDPVAIIAKDIPFQLVILLFFGLSVLLFVPIGQIVGRKMEGLPPLRAYALNVGGSLAGVVLFALSGALWTGPPVWLGISFALLVWFLRDRRVLLIAGVVLAVPFMAFVISEDDAKLWSPYQKISVRERPDGFDLYVNDDRHQFALDLRAPKSPTEIEWRRVYDYPYRAAPKLDRVLIVGSGSGNDVAGALRNGAKHVDAVDIDPGIVRIGRERHPENPYGSDRVTSVIEDARAFFKRPGEPYDLIVFGYLDSHALFSSLSNVRLDEYVYTRESFREAWRRVAPGGAMCVVFCATKPWIRSKLVKMLKDECGQDPFVAISKPEGVDTTILWVGPPPRNPDIPLTIVKPGDVEAPSDDWPFLYLEKRSLPGEYLPILIGVLIIAAGATSWAGRGNFSWVFFLLGAGFMLIETLSITRFALLAGSTWIIVSLTIASILIMSLISTWIVSRFRHPSSAVALGLTVAAIAVSYSVPSESLMNLSLAGRLAVGALVIGLPVLFSGIAFARLFGSTSDPAAALGANLLGAVLGGACEYLSLLFGFSALYMLAGLLYLFALASSRKLVSSPP